MGVEHSAFTGIRSPNRPARSESLNSVFILHFGILVCAGGHVLRRHLSQIEGHRIIFEVTTHTVYEYLMFTDPWLDRLLTCTYSTKRRTRSCDSTLMTIMIVLLKVMLMFVERR